MYQSGASFTAWVVKTVADTVKEMPQVRGIRRGRLRRVVDGVSVPLPVVLRKCNEESVEGIEAEIQGAASQAIEGTGDYELGRKRSGLLMRVFYYLPQFLRLAIMNALLRGTKARKEAMGTVIVTSIASDIRFPGWIIPRTLHNLAIGLGSVVRKPWVVGDSVVPREGTEAEAASDSRPGQRSPVSSYQGVLLDVYA